MNLVYAYNDLLFGYSKSGGKHEGSAPSEVQKLIMAYYSGRYNNNSNQVKMNALSFVPHFNIEQLIDELCLLLHSNIQVSIDVASPNIQSRYANLFELIDCENVVACKCNYNKFNYFVISYIIQDRYCRYTALVEYKNCENSFSGCSRVRKMQSSFADRLRR